MVRVTKQTVYESISAHNWNYQNNNLGVKVKIHSPIILDLWFQFIWCPKTRASRYIFGIESLPPPMSVFSFPASKSDVCRSRICSCHLHPLLRHRTYQGLGPNTRCCCPASTPHSCRRCPPTFAPNACRHRSPTPASDVRRWCRLALTSDTHHWCQPALALDAPS